MKKRRVLALLLALSLAVGMNGMTVLAAGTGETEVTQTSPEGENGNSIEDKTGEKAEGNAESEDHADNVDKDTEDKKQDTEGKEQDSSEEKPGDGTETGDKPGESTGTVGGSETGDGSLEDDKTEETPGDGETGEGELPDGEELPAEGELPTEEEIPVDETDTEATTEDEEEVKQKEEQEEQPAVRMVTFTDDTGMAVTYNAAAQYPLEVDGNGVLTKFTNNDNSAVSGVVALPADQNIKSVGTVFQGNRNITYVKLPAGVESIDDNAFAGCTSLKGVYIPSTVTSIGASAFEGCTRLTQIAIPKKVTSIGAKAFYQDSRLFMVYMKDADYSSLETIGDEAFYECTSLDEFCSDTAFVIPGNLKSIGARAFYKCKSIGEVDLNESVTTMGEEVFRDCTSLRTVSLASTLENIPAYAFAGCNNLVKVNFKPGNKSIGEYAFSGCYNLGGVELSYSVDTIGRYAFQNCSNLISAEIPNGGVTIGEGAFPNDSRLTLVGNDGSEVEKYTKDKAIKFEGYKSYTTSYYTYKVQTLGDGQGTLTVKDANGKDPNTLNSKKGVKYGTKLYVYYTQTKGNELVANSIKCNGTPLSKDGSGKYYFTMPIGGALITAEFTNTASSTKVMGLEEDISVEVSNGELVTDTDNILKEVNLKIGQYSRMFLIDAKDDNKTVDASKITFKTSNKAVATVTSSGMIHAVKSGTAKITATVTGGAGAKITKEIRINVTASDIASLKVKAVSYDASVFKLTESATDHVQTVTADKNSVKKAYTFRLKASAYDEADDDMSTALKWSTSDSKIAKLSSTSTTEASPVNTVTIPANTSGEATVTVTATNADKKTITQKFIISIKDYTPRLVSSSLSINPNKEDGALLEIVNAYANTVDADTVKLKYKVDNTSVVSTDFNLEYLESESDSVVTRFRVKPSSGLSNKTYTVNVSINNDTYSIPLKITVKSSTPNPKVAFAKNQKKINLFYKKDGTEIVVNVSNLGSAEVEEYSLEPLSSSDDNKLFTENFQVAYKSGSSCVITQKSDEIQSTKNQKKNKPAVTGYLVLKFKDYKDTIVKKYKITIPTQTVAPSYALKQTSGSFYADSLDQTITLQLVDKKNKNNPVQLNDSHYGVSIKPGSITAVKDPKITSENKVTLDMSRTSAGKVYLVLTNDTWASGKSFTYTYTVKTSSVAPKISMGSSTVTVNPSYPEQTKAFTLKSNQTDTVISEEQEFDAAINSKTKADTKLQYEKLDITYSDGVGTVEITDPTIKNGTYSFTCYPTYKIGGRNTSSELKANKVTLKVKVAKSVPTVTVKGSAALNKQAMNADNTAYVETSQVSYTVKGLPASYSIDPAATLDADHLKLTTKNCAGYANCFKWSIEDGKIKVSLQEWCPDKTYSFNITPVFVSATAAVDDADDADTGGADDSDASADTLKVTGKTFKVNVKVYNGVISVSLSAKGKLNLLDRGGEIKSSNSIIYTPSIKNLKDTVCEVAVYDANGNIRPEYSKDGSGTSDLFEARVVSGKIYVYPKANAQLANNKTYKVMIWMKLKDYQSFDDADGNGTWSKVLSIKTAQTLPKVKTNKSSVNLYLSNKKYETTFIVDKQLVKSVKPVGKLSSIGFDEKDTKSKGSFTVTYVPQQDGSLQVKLKLKDTVSYSCNSTNKIKMYVKFDGQGTNTAGTAITMNVKINK